MLHETLKDTLIKLARGSIADAANKPSFPTKKITNADLKQKRTRRRSRGPGLSGANSSAFGRAFKKATGKSPKFTNADLMKFKTPVRMAKK